MSRHNDRIARLLARIDAANAKLQPFLSVQTELLYGTEYILQSCEESFLPEPVGINHGTPAERLARLRATQAGHGAHRNFCGVLTIIFGSACIPGGKASSPGQVDAFLVHVRREVAADLQIPFDDTVETLLELAELQMDETEKLLELALKAAP